MDIDKMISDYTDSLMAQAKKWQSMGYSAEVTVEPSEEYGAFTTKKEEKTTEEIVEPEAPVPEKSEESEKVDHTCEFYAEVFAGVYPVAGAKIHIKNDGELIYLLTSDDNGYTEKVTLSSFGRQDYTADVFADGFEFRRDIPVTLGESCLRVQLMPLSDEDG